MIPTTFAEIDLGAYERNVRLVRSIIGSKVKLFAVGKADAYGMGSVRIAKTAINAGAYGIAVSDIFDAKSINKAGINIPILLYACTPPNLAAEIANMNLIATIHSFESLNAFADLKKKVKIFLKIDCGFGRLGFQPENLDEVFLKIKSSKNIELIGIYTHFGHVGKDTLVEDQTEIFNNAVNDAESAGFEELVIMAASSRIIIGYPKLYYNAVNPGGMLFGVLEEPWCNQIKVEHVLKSVKSEIIQIKELKIGSQPSYAPIEILDKVVRIAVVPFGFRNGYPRLPSGGRVLISGISAPVLGSRGTEHTVVDITNVTNAKVGSEVVILGKQEKSNISANEISEHTGVPLIELIPRLASGSFRNYIN